MTGEFSSYASKSQNVQCNLIRVNIMNIVVNTCLVHPQLGVLSIHPAVLLTVTRRSAIHLLTVVCHSVRYQEQLAGMRQLEYLIIILLLILYYVNFITH